MSDTLVIDGVRLAIGLNWMSLRSETSEKNEASELAKESGCDFGTIFSSDSISFLGLYEGTPGKSPVICGAAAVAVGAKQKKKNNVVLVETLPDDLVWLCAVRNGAPLKGYDVVVPISEVNKIVDNLVRDYNDFEIFSRDGFLPNSEAIGFLDVVGNEDGSLPDKLPKIVRLNGVSRMFLVGLGTLFLGGVLIAAGYLYFNSKEEALAALEAASNMRMQAAATQAEIAKLEVDANDKINTQFKTKLGGAPTYDDAVNLWMSAIDNAPSDLAGWKLAKIECTQILCIGSYRREKIGTLNDFLSKAKSINLQFGKITGNEVVVNFPLQIKTRNYLPNQLPGEEEGFWPLLTKLQKLELAGLTFEVGEAKKLDAMTANIPNHPARKITSTWLVGDYKVAGKNIYEIRDSIEYLKFPNISAVSLNINIEVGSWIIGGSYGTK